MSATIITLTKDACDHLRDTLSKHKPPAFFRLSIKETGCTGLMYVPEIVDQPKEGDIEITSNNLCIYIAKDAEYAIVGTTIDYVTTGLGQKQLAYDNPNAESLCGCGESFNLKSNEKK